MMPTSTSCLIDRRVCSLRLRAVARRKQRSEHEASVSVPPTFAVLFQLLGDGLYVDLLLWTVVVFKHRRIVDPLHSIGSMVIFECHHMENAICGLPTGSIV